MPSNDSAFGTKILDNLLILSSTASTSSTTGAIVCSGGLGVSGNLHVGGTITGGGISYATTSTGTLDITDDPGTTLTVQSTEQCTGVGTGSATFDGGVYIAKNLYVDGTLVAGSITYASTSTGTLTITNSPGTTLECDSTEDSTSKTTGAAVFSGGIGVDKNISAGSIQLYGGTQSTSPTTGVIIAAGGIGATGNIYSGGSVVAGNITSTGTVVNGGFDFVLGNSDQISRGNSGASRAIIKDTGNILTLNYSGDFTGGTKINSNLHVTGTSTVTGTSIFNGITDNGSSIFSGITVNGTSAFNGITVNGESTFTGITVSGESVLSGLTVSGTSTINGLTVNGSSTFTGVLAAGTSTLTGLTVNGNSTFSGVTVNSQMVANSGVTLNAGMVANSAVTIAGAVGNSALTIAGSVGFSALTIQFGATNIFDITENSTTVNNVNITNILDVTNEVKVNNTTVIMNDAGSLNLYVNNANVSGTTTSTTMNATSTVQVNSTPVITNDGGSLNLDVDNANVSGTTSSGTLNATSQLQINGNLLASESGGVVTTDTDVLKIASKTAVDSSGTALRINSASQFTQVDVTGAAIVSAGMTVGGNLTAANYNTTTHAMTVKRVSDDVIVSTLESNCRIIQFRDFKKIIFYAHINISIPFYFEVNLAEDLFFGLSTYPNLKYSAVEFNDAFLHGGFGFGKSTDMGGGVWRHRFYFQRSPDQRLWSDNLDRVSAGAPYGLMHTNFYSQMRVWAQMDIY